MLSLIFCLIGFYNVLLCYESNNGKLKKSNIIIFNMISNKCNWFFVLI